MRQGTYKLEHLTQFVATEVQDIDVRRIEKDEIVELRSLLVERGVLVFRDQRLTVRDHVRFSKWFGTLVHHLLGEYLVPGHPEILVISNIVEDGKPIGLFDGDQIDWHSDGSWSNRPSLGSLMYCIEAPSEGGETWFATSEAPYAELPSSIRRWLTSLKAVHSLDCLTERQREFSPTKMPLTEEQRKASPDIVHPLVRRHPETGSPSLFVGSLVVKKVCGLSDDAGHGLVQSLIEHATQEKFVYRHRWQEGDLVFWDNRSTLHTVTPCDRELNRRRLHRTTIEGDRVMSATGQV
jgi:taurine dioxygenase